MRVLPGKHASLRFAGLHHFGIRQFAYRVRNRVPWPELAYLVNERHKFIYCPIQKIACSSLMRWFLWSHGIADEQIHDPHEQVLEFQMRRLPARKALSILQDRDFFTFAFVRNPWARMVSAHLNLLLSRNPVSEPVLQHAHSRRKEAPATEIPSGGWTDLTFREFLEFLTHGNPRTFNVHWKPQHLFFTGNRLDYIGRFEQLDEDFDVVRERLGIGARLPRVNSTRYTSSQPTTTEIVADWTPEQLLVLPAHPKYPQFYAPEMREIVARIYARDVEMFGYSFEG